MKPDFVAVERVPSLALRVVRVAEGSIDVGLVSPNARDWDLAGADLILREAGDRSATSRDGRRPTTAPTRSMANSSPCPGACAVRS